MLDAVTSCLANGSAGDELVVSCKKLSLARGKKVCIDRLDLVVRPARITGLIGSDGAGKTTLLHLIAGVMEPSAGEIRVLGKRPRDARLDIAYVTQNNSLFPELTVEENLVYSAGVRNVPRDVFEEREAEYLATFGLEKFTSRLAKDLSGGMKQKVALLCALISMPKLLLLDEPTSGLDPIARREFWQMLSKVCESGITAIVATPRMEEGELCTEIAWMHEGRVYCSGSPRQLRQTSNACRLSLKSSDPELLISLISDADFRERACITSMTRQSNETILLVNDAKKAPDLVMERLQQNGVVFEMTRSQASLDDVFLIYQSTNRIGDFSGADPAMPDSLSADPGVARVEDSALSRAERASESAIPSPTSADLTRSELTSPESTSPEFASIQSASSESAATKSAKTEPSQTRSDSTSSLDQSLNKNPITHLDESPVPNARVNPPDHRSAAIRTDSLSKRFGSFTAVDNVSIEIKYGEIYGLLGANGAGKTSTIKMICGLLKPSEGAVSIAGKVRDPREHEWRSKLGYMSQKMALYRDLTGLENLQFYAATYGISGKQLKERIKWADELVDLENALQIPVGVLPGGLQQRLAFVTAILHQPEILILDEPTSGIDPVGRRQMWNIIRQMVQSGIAVLVTTHFIEEAEYCDRIGVMTQGRLVGEAAPSAIKAEAGKVLEILTPDARGVFDCLSNHIAPWRISILPDCLHIQSEKGQISSSLIERELRIGGFEFTKPRLIAPSLEEAVISLVHDAGASGK